MTFMRTETDTRMFLRSVPMFFICFLSLFIVRVFKTWELDQSWSVYSKDLSEMDLLCTECAKVFAKEVDLIAHQARAHDTRHFTCTECQAFLVGKDQQRNHMRQHMRKEKSLSIRTCTLCPYETRFKHNLNRHTAKAHTAKEKEPKTKLDLLLPPPHLVGPTLFSGGITLSCCSSVFQSNYGNLIFS